MILHKRGDVVYVESNIDNSDYLVQNTETKQQSANILAKIKQNIMSLNAHLQTHKNGKYSPYKEQIERLNDKINSTLFSENDPHSSYTSYSVNKGDEIVFCLKSKKTNEYHDMNLMMYVAIHELAHVANKEYGHGESFKMIFAFLASAALEANIYNKIDFKSYPTEYCGMDITESII